jgi:tetratricopeptide (TPR) repeat protein
VSRWARLLAALTLPRLLIAGAGILVGLGLWLGFWLRQESYESRGLLALAEAGTLVREAQRPEAAEARERAAQALEAVVTGYPRLSAAPQAAYQLGNLRFEAKQWAAARGAYQLALAKGAQGTLRRLSALGIAYAAEAEGNHAEAASALGALLREPEPRDFLREEALLALARVQELGGKPEAALETLRRFVTEMPESPRRDDVRLMVARLESRSRK